MYTLLYLRRITNKDILSSTWDSAGCYVAAWMGGEFRGEWITCICVVEYLRCYLKTLTVLLTSCTPIQN